jgi:hypothetical protein
MGDDRPAALRCSVPIPTAGAVCRRAMDSERHADPERRGGRSLQAALPPDAGNPSRRMAFRAATVGAFLLRTDQYVRRFCEYLATDGNHPRAMKVNHEFFRDLGRRGRFAQMA